MIVNCFNVKWAAKVQIVFAISAVVALVMIIGIGVYAMATSKGPFTPSECGSESEKYQRTGENDQRIKGNIKGNVRFLHLLSLGVNKLKQECIPVGCVPTAAVATTRCQHPGWWEGVSAY